MTTVLLACLVGLSCGETTEPVQPVDTFDIEPEDLGQPADRVAEMRPEEAFAEAAVLETVELIPEEIFGDFELVEEDLGILPGEAGYPCQTGENCQSGYCIQTPSGKQCTIACIEECPFDWVCVLHKPSLPDDVFLCMPLRMNLCKPCDKNSDCLTNGAELGDACVPYGAPGSFCGATCMGGVDCPDDYECKKVLDVWGFESQQCILTFGTCECEQWFVDEQATTTCLVENDYGACEGTRQCTVAGLSECDAPEPKKESCNALDDDCDGDTDEGAGGDACFSENEFGACKGEYECLAGNLVCDAAIPEPELCDGKDNNCDGSTDEGYPDSDLDGMADCLEADKDGDGIMDFEDNCKYASNPGQEDFDLDGMGDACDADDDNDMSADEDDCKPLNPKVNPDALEVCNGFDDDCDAIVDEGFPDSDSDALADCIDDDDDNDGFPDSSDCAPTDAEIYPGAKEACDGVDNDCDYDIDEQFPDVDGDDVADCVDPDLDGDAIENDQDNCPKASNPGQEDADNDGYGDVCDPDVDGDGIPDGTDNCLNLFNPGQKDLDEDGTGDKCDQDIDGDDILNQEDNCHLVSNAGQDDQDEDGVGDACDEDADGDGDPDETDCAPNDPYVHQSAEEECDFVDNNCNNLVDEGYPDSDADDIKDCVDPDDDNDGDPDLTDCGPLDASVYSGAAESCNGFDDDCDGEFDEELGTISCGKGACEHEEPACKDGMPGSCDPFDGALEEMCDGVDNDCDGLTDEDLGWETCGAGKCLHTIPSCEEGEPGKCDPFFGAVDEKCDGQDNDCDGEVDEELGTTECGLGECTHSVVNCKSGVPVVCDEFEGAVPEICDGKDNDCDGDEDEDFPDLDGDGAVNCLDKDDDGDGDPDLTDCAPEDLLIHHGATEECDGVDNNCEGGVDEEGAQGCQEYFSDVDWDGHGSGEPKCLCEPTALYKTVLDDDCNDLNPWVFPGATEMCDGVDNDCDNEVDEEGATGCNWFFADPDLDGYGSGEPVCSCDAPGNGWAVMGGDCDEESSDIHPGALELCDEEDNDCDQEVDEGIDLDNDVNNCGMCGKSCQPNNAFGSCLGGQCKIADCITGYKDCNEKYADGCETNVFQDAVNCGDCSAVCTLPHATEVCINGSCAVGGCDAHYTDKNSVPEDGCENLTYGKQADDPGLSCFDIKTFDAGVVDGNFWLDPNGGAHVDSYQTFCNMSTGKNAPDFKLVTPDDFYHGDNTTKYGNSNGVNVFNYSCDACGQAKEWYEYLCPDQYWEVLYYNIRSHCNHSNHKSCQVFTSETFSQGGVPGVRFRQHSDDCGDPNEFTIVGVCRTKNTGTADPGGWDNHFRNVSWSN